MEYLDWCKDNKELSLPEWVITITIFNPDTNRDIQYILDCVPLYAYDYKQHSVASECIDYSHATIKFPFSKEYHTLKENMLKNIPLNITFFQGNKTKTNRVIAFHKCKISELSEYNQEVTLTFIYMSESNAFKTKKGVHASIINFEEYTLFEKEYDNIQKYFIASEDKLR